MYRGFLVLRRFIVWSIDVSYRLDLLCITCLGASAVHLHTSNVMRVNSSPVGHQLPR
jgi:hypothetical protein